MKKKKKGYTLVFLLAMSMIITIVGGVLIGAISYTRNANNSIKINQDLVYAAESGIEQAISNIQNSASSNIDVDKDGITDSIDSKLKFDLNSKFNSKNINVIVEITEIVSGSEYDVKSVATSTIDTSRKKEVKAKIKRNITITNATGNLLKYSLCAKSVNIYHNISSGITSETINDLTAKINSVNGVNFTYIANEGTSYPFPAPSTTNQDFIIPTFKFNQASDNIIVSNIEELKQKAMVTNSGVKMESLHGMNVFYINVKPNKGLIVENGGGTLSHSIIICNGSITLSPKVSDLGSGIQEDGTFVGTTEFTGLLPQSLSYLTLVANRINIYTSSLFLSFPSYGTDFSPLDENKKNDIDSMISGTCDNWSSSVGTTTEEWGALDVEYN